MNKSIENDLFPLSEMELTYLREKIMYYMMDQDYENSVFWAEKVYMLTKIEKDLYIYLQNLLTARRFRETLAIIEQKYVDKSNLKNSEKYLIDAPLWIRYFAAKCYTNFGKCTKSLELLYDVEPTTSLEDLKSNSFMSISSLKNQFNQTKIDVSNSEEIKKEDNYINYNQIIASAARHKGTILEYIGDNQSASYFATSLIKDLFQFSCGRKLFENKMISSKEIYCFIEGYLNLINNDKIYYKKLNKIAISFYFLASDLFGLYTDNKLNNDLVFINKDLKKWPENLVIITKLVVEKFYSSCDLLRWQANNYICSDNFTKALELTQKIISVTNMDDYLGCVMHALILFKSGRTIDLKILCDLLSVDATLSINKQIVYKIICSIRDLSIGNAAKSQESLKNSVTLASMAALRSTSWLISPAILYLILGHAAWLAGDKEHALAAFNSAADTSPGLYITWFFIGALHAETEETSLALNYFIKSHKIAINQYFGVPLFMANEIACGLAKKGNYQYAISILLNSLGDGAKNEKILLNNIIEKKDPKLYHTILHNLGYCCFKNGMLREALKYIQVAHSINNNSIKTQKLLGVLLDYFGNHKEAQFLYQNVILEVSKLSELKLSVKGRTLRGRNCQILPPETTNSFNTVEHDKFCMKMIERSIFIEKNKMDMEVLNQKIQKNQEKTSISDNFKNTSLSFNDQ